MGGFGTSSDWRPSPKREEESNFWVHLWAIVTFVAVVYAISTLPPGGRARIS